MLNCKLHGILSGAVLLCGFSTMLFGPVSASDPATIEEILKIEADPDYGQYLAGECLVHCIKQYSHTSRLTKVLDF